MIIFIFSLQGVDSRGKFEIFGFMLQESTLVKLKIHALPNTFTSDKFLLKTFDFFICFWPPHEIFIRACSDFRLFPQFAKQLTKKIYAHKINESLFRVLIEKK